MIPRYYQQESHDAAWDYLRKQSGNPLIVLPTGAGKSLVIAMLIQQAIEYDARVIVLQHRKELIEQNAEKVQILCPGIEFGINSAGLKERDYKAPVVFAGIQSVFRKAPEFGRRELVLIDEAHLVNQESDSMYGVFLNELLSINANARIIGLTATPYRTGEGKLCGPNKMFQKVCYESKTGDLIDEGFLCRLTNQASVNQADMTNVRVSRGDYIESEMEDAFMVVVDAATTELVAKTADRNSILVFSAGVDHAYAIKEQIGNKTGETVRVITGETLPIERSQWLQEFKEGRLRWLVNCMVLTTGFDAPCIDAVAVLRATTSPGLFAQIVGRGLRKHETKEDSLILDFGGNIARHGSLDSPSYGFSEPKGNGTGEAPEKNCPNCEEPSPISATDCDTCGFRFPPSDPDSKHDVSADENSTLIGEPEPEIWLVESVKVGEWNKRSDPDAPPTLRVDYKSHRSGRAGNLEGETISEWVCFEHQGFARTKAEQWWSERSVAPAPKTIQEAIEKVDRHQCRFPSMIMTKADGKWRRIAECHFIDEKPDPSEWVEVELYADDEVPF